MNPRLPPAIPAPDMPPKSLTALNLALGRGPLRQQHDGVGTGLENGPSQRTVEIPPRGSTTCGHLLGANLLFEFFARDSQRLHSRQRRQASTGKVHHLDHRIAGKLPQHPQEFCSGNVDAPRSIDIEIAIDIARHPSRDIGEKYDPLRIERNTMVSNHTRSSGVFICALFARCVRVDFRNRSSSGFLQPGLLSAFPP